MSASISADRREFVIVARLRGFLGRLDPSTTSSSTTIVLVVGVSVEIDIVMVLVVLVPRVVGSPLESQPLLHLADDSRENLAKDLGEPGPLDRVIARGDLCTINKVGPVVAGDGRVADQFQESVKPSGPYAAIASPATWPVSSL